VASQALAVPKERARLVGLLIDDVASQVLEQTRVIANGPVLAPDEALHVEVVPGGGGGSQPVSDVLNLGLTGTNQLDVLQLDVSYELQRDGLPLASQDYIQVPSPPTGGSTAALLAVAFLIAPHVKLVKAAKPLDVRPGLPKLDYKLVVTITISSKTGQLPQPLARTIEIPFTVPTIEVPLPVLPAVCICAQDDSLNGQKYLIMLPPGSPESVSEIVAAYNSVLDTLNGLESLLSALAVALTPLKKVVSTLAAIPTPYVTTSARVQDFDDYNDFDDEMSSFLLVAPPGYGVRFSDTANPGDWDDFGDNAWKLYTAIDLLQLPSDQKHGDYMLKQLAMDKAEVSKLADDVAALAGVPVDKATLGIGVCYVHNLDGADTPDDFKYYDNQHETVQDDTESALWTTG
jgi:hypothetical protein